MSFNTSPSTTSAFFFLKQATNPTKGDPNSAEKGLISTQNVQNNVESSERFSFNQNVSNLTPKYANSVKCKDSHLRFHVEQKKKPKTRRAVLGSSIQTRHSGFHGFNENTATDVVSFEALSINSVKKKLGDEAKVTLGSSCDDSIQDVQKAFTFLLSDIRPDEVVTDPFSLNTVKIETENKACDSLPYDNPPAPDVSFSNKNTALHRNSILKASSRYLPILSHSRDDLQDIFQNISDELKNSTSEIYSFLDSLQVNSTSLNITEEIDRLSSELAECQKLQNSYIGSDNFIEAEKINEEIQMKKDKIFQLEIMMLTSPSASYIRMQENLFSLSQKFYNVSHSSLNALLERRTQLISDINLGTQNQVSDVSHYAEKLRFEWERINLEMARVQKQKETVDAEKLEIKNKITEETLHYEEALQAALTKQIVIDKEIEELKKQLEEKLQTKKDLETITFRYNQEICSTNEKFQKQLTRLDLVENMLKETEDDAELENEKLQTLRKTLQEKKKNIQYDLCSFALLLGALTLACNDLEEKIVHPARVVERLRSNFVAQLTGFNESTSDSYGMIELREKQNQVLDQIQNLVQKLCNGEKKRIGLMNQYEVLSSRKETAVKSKQFREAASLTEEIRHINSALSLLNTDLAVVGEELEKLERESERLRSQETLLRQELFLSNRSRALQYLEIFKQFVATIRSFSKHTREITSNRCLCQLDTAQQSSLPWETNSEVPFLNYLQLLDALSIRIPQEGLNAFPLAKADQELYNQLKEYLSCDPLLQSVNSVCQASLKHSELLECESQLLEKAYQQWKVYFKLDEEKQQDSSRDISEDQISTAPDTVNEDRKKKNFKSLLDEFSLALMHISNMENLLTLDSKENTVENSTVEIGRANLSNNDLSLNDTSVAVQNTIKENFPSLLQSAQPDPQDETKENTPIKLASHTNIVLTQESPHYADDPKSYCSEKLRFASSMSCCSENSSSTENKQPCKETILIHSLSAPELDKELSGNLSHNDSFEINQLFIDKTLEA